MTKSTKQFIIRQRFLIVQDYLEGMQVTDIARKYRTSRPTVYRWIKRYEEEGTEGLLDRSHRPKSRHPNSLPPRIRRRIVRLREKTHYGPARIRDLLRQEGLDAGETTIYRVLLQQNLINRHHKRRKPKPKRYVAPYPGFCVQIDTKYLDTFPGRPDRYYQYTAIDDCSRMRVLRIYDELSAYNACSFLEEVIKTFPFTIEAVRTDNGSEFTNGPFKREHPFTSLCVRRGIKHILNPVAHPQSNGKVERSHRTDDEEFYRVVQAQRPEDWVRQIGRWETFYNYRRAHSELDKLTPYQRYMQFKKSEVKNVT